MTSIEVSNVVDGFKNLHEGKPLTEEQLLHVKDLIFGGYYFTSYLISDIDRNNIYNATVDTIHESFNQMLKNIVSLGCIYMNGPITIIEENEITEE